MLLPVATAVATIATNVAAVIEIVDREPIERFARRDLGMHLYELGDLDPFFWPHTQWFGLPRADGELAALALLYGSPQIPTLLALGRQDSEATAQLLAAIAPRIPLPVYAHLVPGQLTILGDRVRPQAHGLHLKMEHRDRDRLALRTDDVDRLGPSDHDDLLELYGRSYPGNWFDARMLETGQYYGIRSEGALVCVAGVHVYSPRYRVAALGNVTTDPGARGRGLARRATARLCRSLYATVDTIGLNVHADNQAAIACYRSLGFETIGEYEEFALEAR
ncbi:MAG: GNAT family N-acetyltransferase [Deltaproteobacteria bacterium]|nr:GNAT family N-acetyltransferase [Deltaproteobacteria bacterium]